MQDKSQVLAKNNTYKVNNFRFKRIAVVGSAGSGKTFLAQKLSLLLNIPHIELDYYSFGPNWQMRPNEDFRRDVAKALAADAWIADGNYSRARDIIWARADLVIWLDYPFLFTLGRLARRTLKRWWNQDEYWHGNRESLRRQFMSRHSIFLWVLKTHRKRRCEFLAAMQHPQYAHITFVRLCSPQETDAWFEKIV